MDTFQKKKLVSLGEAIKISNKIIDELKPFCIRISIVGSIRREKKQIGDVEILCIPKTIEESTDLFGEDHPRVEGFINTINKWEKVKGDPECGRYTQRIHPSGIKVDIFIVEPDNWGLHMVIRTGSWEYSKRMLGQTIKQAGYYSEGGFLRDLKTNKIVPVKEEKDFYNLINEPWTLPLTRVG